MLRYASLHNHTSKSIRDAIPTPEEYVRAIHNFNADVNNINKYSINALAITEHGNLFSLVDHHIACNNKIKGEATQFTTKSIYGNEVYHCMQSDYNKACKPSGEFRSHLVLLAKNAVGLKNLYKITSQGGFNKWSSYQICFDEYIKSHGEGIIGLSACVGGRMGKLIIDGQYDEAKAFAIEMNNSLDEFYLEIQPHDFPSQLLVNDALVRISQETGIKMVITSDSHYVYKTDNIYHDIMKDMDKSRRFTTDNHFWTPDELEEWCVDNNFDTQIIENTALIADMCTADISPTDSKGLMPDYPCPPGHTEDSYLKKLVFEGVRWRFEENKDIVDINTYIIRLNYELDVITQMQFSGYFLILWDWFVWCAKNDILLGPGRGSGAGSLVSYALNITKVDPIKNGLIFERFLNIERIEMPDIWRFNTSYSQC